jgi:hypothetical protein
MAAVHETNDTTGVDEPIVTASAMAFTNNVKANSLLVLVGQLSQAPTSSTLTDSRGNTWTIETFLDGGSSISLVMGWCINAGGAGACTVTFTPTVAGNWRWCLAEYSAVETTTPLDQKQTNLAQTSATPTSNATSTLATTDSLVIGGVATDDGRTFTAGTNFTLRSQSPSGASAGRSGLEDRNYTSTTGIAATWLMSASVGYSAGVWVFKAAVAAVSISPGLGSVPQTGQAPILGFGIGLPDVP